MEDALPYRRLLSLDNNVNSLTLSTNTNTNMIYNKSDLKKVVTKNSVIVFEKRKCCMSHVVKCLLQGLGVNPAIYEVDEKVEKNVLDELQKIHGEKGRLQLPVVFIGGRLIGGLDRIMAAHISGELTPELKQAGALWL